MAGRGRGGGRRDTPAVRPYSALGAARRGAYYGWGRAQPSRSGLSRTQVDPVSQRCTPGRGPGGARRGERGLWKGLLLPGTQPQGATRWLGGHKAPSRAPYRLPLPFHKACASRPLAEFGSRFSPLYDSSHTLLQIPACPRPSPLPAPGWLEPLQL